MIGYSDIYNIKNVKTIDIVVHRSNIYFLGNTYSKIKSENEEDIKMNQINQKIKRNQLLVTLCLTSVFLLLLLCGGDPSTNGDTAMHDYICTNGVKASGTTTTPNTQKCESCTFTPTSNPPAFYTLEDESCVEVYSYSCTNGVPPIPDGSTTMTKEMTTAMNENTQKCSSCTTDGFALDNAMCVMIPVSISLDCTTGRASNSRCMSSPKLISNTIINDNLPIYTVARSVSTSDPLTVTLKWVITASDGSGVSTRYVESPPKTAVTMGNFRTCDVISESHYYSFKFLGNDTDPAPTVDNTNKSITVTIPANSKTVAFRLDPYECPDSNSRLTNRHAARVNGPFGAFSSANVSIGITATSNNEASDPTSEKLKIEYENGDSKCTGTGNSFTCAGSDD